MRSKGGEGPYVGEAETGGEQGEWVWRQINEIGGKVYAPVRRNFNLGRDYQRSRSDSRGGARVTPPGGRVFIDKRRGRSQTSRHGRPFSCSRDAMGRHRSRFQSGLDAERFGYSNGNVKQHFNGSFNGNNSFAPQWSRFGNGNNSNVSRSVSAVFYITNFPERLLHVDLKKGLEVCGILSDVYLSRFRNVRGQRFGFAKFLKVRDVEKLKKALNNVSFWDRRLFANVAKFDRFDAADGGSARSVEYDVGKKHEGEKNRGNKEGKKSRELLVKEDEKGDSRKLALEKVKVAAIRSELEREREKGLTAGDVGGSEEVKEEGRPKAVVGEGSESVYGIVASEVVREYLPYHDDVVWANKCILAKVKDGKSFSGIQQSFLDAGFLDYNLISMGGDNVMLHPSVDGDVTDVFNSATDFLSNFLCDCRPWTKDIKVQYEMGAWVRCYGVPLHAWNDIFFLELAATCGRLLKIDDVTVNKDRMDYARFLIATPDLKELNYVAQFVIDGRLYPIRFIEDLEFGLAEDACLAEFEDDNNSQCSVPECMPQDEPLIDALVHHIQEDFVKNSKVINGAAESADFPSSQGKTEQFVAKEIAAPSHIPVQAESAVVKGDDESFKGAKNIAPIRRKVASSFTSLKKIARLSETDRNALIKSLKKAKMSKRYFLKGKSSKTSSKISSCKTNKVSLSAGSGTSGNTKDWENWVVLHGNAKEVEEDVVELGKKIDLRCNNSFQVLSRGGVRGGSDGGGSGREDGVRGV
uniref:RNA-binding region RNP-1 (RNA recognition motif) n=1 Tax=Medicago truncatula TaxID=3880 RepID=A2Q4W6_MEDTR|nr:RNA-binding region RNP-1 (RNA recognition motif) [Medicago truncatula]